MAKVGALSGFKGLKYPTYFTVSSVTQTVQLGHPYKINYTVTPSDASNKKVSWSSSNTNIATISDNGTIMPVAVGECVITGTLTSNQLSQSITVTIYVVHTTGVELDTDSIMLYPGTTHQLTATLYPSNTNFPELIWSSSDTSIAIVNNDGLVSYVGVGECVITCTTVDGGFTDTCSVTAGIPVEGVSLNVDSGTLYQNDTLQLVATITPDDASIKTVIWSSSDDEVATVDDNGLVTFVGDGNCIITCTTVDGGFTATCSITCIAFQPIDRCFGYTGAVQCITLLPHTYCLEVWGASGFGNESANAGRGGGYSSGCITLTANTTLYIYVGQHPTGQTGGWNGGGNGRYSYGMGGGGASDMRIGGQTLYHRFIVAGGSGGGNCTLNCYGQGGAGGGVCGMEGYYNAHYRQGQARSGGGAGPNYGGCAWSSGGSAGTFGQGGCSCSGYNAGGGGGGWYGGGGAYDNDSDNDGRGGGGGSGYVWTAANCQYHPAPTCLSGVPYLVNACTCAGNSTFPTASGGTEIGHFGHGCVKIVSL